MNLKKLMLIVLAMALAITCFAQGGGRRGGMFGRMGGPSMLLRRADVQADLALTDEQKAKLDQIQQDARSQMRELFQSGDREAAQQQMPAIFKKSGEASMAVLTDAQKARLNEINIQLNGSEALINNNELQEKVGLSDDQKAKIADLMKSQQAANQAIGDKMRNQEIQPDEARAAFEKNQKAMKDELDKLLTDDQKNKLNGMKGKTFTATENNGGGLELLLRL